VTSSSDRQAALELWQVLLNTSFSLRHSVRPIFTAHGLTGPQWRIFRMLGERSGPGLTPGQISEALHVTPGNTTGVLDKLEEAGLVERHPHPDDRRALLIGLTERGVEVYRQVRPAFDRRVAELFSCLTEDEKREMTAGLQRLLQHVGPARCGGRDEADGRGAGP
jgi:DNA-binding MarR family transcriptional regulator